MKIRIEFKLEDMWVGWFWRNKTVNMPPNDPIKIVKTFDLWICVVPCFPLHITNVRVTDGKRIRKAPT